MIITSPIELEIGKIYNQNNMHLPFEFKGIKYEHYALLVIRIATKEEFISYANELYNGDINNLIYLKYYYKISVD